MGHIVAKDIYRKLGTTIDNTPVRTPWNKAFRSMLEALYTPQEAELVTKMPYRPSSIGRIQAVSGMPQARLQNMLNDLCSKGLVLDVREGDEALYMISPLAIGIFEFTMMRTGGDLPYAKWAELFDNYIFGDTTFFDANFGNGERVSIMRALPHEQAIADTDHVEILDYEKASAMVESNTQFAVGLCSCRHEKHHLGERHCDTPMETCTTMGSGAEFMIENGFARRTDKSEMRDIFARSKELALTLTTDNVKHGASFVCHCCGCCCNLMRGIRESGHPGVIVTSTYIAECDSEACNGCGLCAKACPIDAIHCAAPDDTQQPRPTAVVDRDFCLGCGACALKCKRNAISLVKREQNILHPEDSFERVILQSLERGTLQNLVFDNPNSRTQDFMRGLVGGFLKLSPVKRALMSETLRSRFLHGIRKAAL